MSDKPEYARGVKGEIDQRPKRLGEAIKADDSVLSGDGLSKVKVEATITGHERGKKIHGLKFKPKRGYKVRYGARADLTRIRDAIAFAPKVPLEEGLRRFVEWFRGYYKL